MNIIMLCIQANIPKVGTFFASLMHNGIFMDST